MLSVKVGDLVRRVNLPEHEPHWLTPHVGVIVLEIEEFMDEPLKDRLFKVFWGAHYGTFVSSASKLELVE